MGSSSTRVTSMTRNTSAGMIQQAPVAAPAPVIYPTGRYVLYGDGVT